MVGFENIYESHSHSNRGNSVMTFLFLLLRAHLLQKRPYKNRSNVTCISNTIENQWNPIEICSDYGWFAFVQLGVLGRCWHQYVDITAELSTWAGLLVWSNARKWIQSHSTKMGEGDGERLLHLQKQEYGVLSFTKKIRWRPRRTCITNYFGTSARVFHIQCIVDILDKLLESPLLGRGW